MSTPAVGLVSMVVDHCCEPSDASSAVIVSLSLATMTLLPFSAGPFGPITGWLNFVLHSWLPSSTFNAVTLLARSWK
jgi:hypothetical protein